MQRIEYKETFAISQSSIKAYKSKPIQKFKSVYIDKEDDEEDQTKFVFGSLVDTLALQPDQLNERFYIPDEDVSIPGEKVKNIIDKVYKEALSIVENKIKLNEQGNLPEPIYIPSISDLSEWNELSLKYAKEIKYGGTTWSSSRILDNIYADGANYFRLLGLSGGRAVITLQDNADAIAMVEALRTNKESQPYFVEQEDETLLFQQEIYVDYQVTEETILPLKAALDIVRINHKEQTVVVPDLKTTHNAAGFKHIAKSFDYVTQVSFYTFLIKEFLKTFRGGKYKDYKILPPINIAIDREYKVPLVYVYDEEDIKIAELGSKEHEFRGWREILNDISWHLENSVWDKPREAHEKGCIKLKIFT